MWQFTVTEANIYQLLTNRWVEGKKGINFKDVLLPKAWRSKWGIKDDFWVLVLR